MLELIAHMRDVDSSYRIGRDNCENLSVQHCLERFLRFDYRRWAKQARCVDGLIRFHFGLMR